MSGALKPLLTRVPRAELDARHQAMWDAANTRVGTGAMVEVLANHMAATDFYTDEMYPLLYSNQRGGMLVPTRLKELFRFRMGQRHGCSTCIGRTVDWDYTIAMGFTQEQLENVVDPPPGLFSDEELAVMELADQFVLWNLEASLTPELHERLSRHLSDAQILELGTLGAFFMGWQRLMFVFDLTPRMASCPVPSPSQSLAGSDRS